MRRKGKTRTHFFLFFFYFDIFLLIPEGNCSKSPSLVPNKSVREVHDEPNVNVRYKFIQSRSSIPVSKKICFTRCTALGQEVNPSACGNVGSLGSNMPKQALCPPTHTLQMLSDPHREKRTLPRMPFLLRKYLRAALLPLYAPSAVFSPSTWAQLYFTHSEFFAHPLTCEPSGGEGGVRENTSMARRLQRD